MRRALYVSAFVPNALGGHAGARVANENLVQLRTAFGAVDALVCTTESAGVAPAPEGVEVFRQTWPTLLSYLLTHGRSLGWRGVVSSPVIHTRLHAGAEARLRELQRQQKYDEVFVDFTQALLLVLRALGHPRPSMLRVCIHDVFVQRMARSSRPLDVLLAGAVIQEELAALAQTDGIVVLSDKDREVVRSIYAIPRVEVKPFEPPPWCRSVVRQPATIDPNMLLFFANFDRPENAEGLRWLLGEAFTAIRAGRPNTRLCLVGTGSSELATRLGDDRVTGVGFVADPSPYFSRCALAVAPLFEGAGVKFKVLEALAARVPVVGTPVACEGIPQQSLLVRAEPAHFASAVVECLQRTSDNAQLP